MNGLAIAAGLAVQAATQTGAPPASAASNGVATSPAATTRTTGESSYVDVEAGATYSTNPLLSLGDSTGSGSGRISAHAVHTSVTDRTTTLLSGFAQTVFYTSRYGSAQSFDLNGRHDAAVNEELHLFVDADASYDRGGQLDTRILAIPEVPLLPGTIVPPPLLGPGSDFLTLTGKSFHARLGGGGQLAISSRDSLDLSAAVEHDIAKNGSLNTRFTTVPISLGYNRQLNERATVGARVVGEFTHYAGDVLNGTRDFHVITPELTGQLRLSEHLTFSGDVGASFSSANTVARAQNSTGLAGDVNLCSSTERSEFCGRLSVQQQAATSAGPSRVVSAELDYSRKLSPGDTLQLSVSGERYSNPVLVVALPTFSRSLYLRAAADYSHRIGTRLYTGADIAARELSQTGPKPNADFSATVFIRYRLGNAR